MPKKSPILATFEKNIGLPASQWAGNCFGVAMKAVELKLVPKGSVAVYGHWIGAVHAESMFSYRAGTFVQHGWVLMPDGNVCDPTRWVFENVKPYVYFGPADHYDEGGNVRRSKAIGPPPAYDPDDEQHRLNPAILSGPAWKFVEKLLRLDETLEVEPGDISVNQLHWLANCSPNGLGEHAGAIYDALDALQLGAFVPWDNRQMVKRLRQK